MRIAVGFNPGVLQDDVAVHDGTWTYFPNALLNRYGALRDRGHIRVSASELQGALVRYLWVAGARHSPSEEMSGECAGLEYAGWSVADVDDVLLALAGGRDLVDVAGRSLIAKYGESIATADTTIPGPATPWPPVPPPPAAVAVRGPFDGATLPVPDGTFTGVVDVASLAPGMTAVAPEWTFCSRALPIGGAGLVAGEPHFAHGEFGAASPDLRLAGLGVGGSLAPDDRALALALRAVRTATAQTFESYVELDLPAEVATVEFDYLYWAENWVADLVRIAEPLYPLTLADVVAWSPLAGSTERILFDPGGGNEPLASGLNVLGGPTADPCCPTGRMSDPLWGQPNLYDAGSMCPSGIELSPAGSLCSQSYFTGWTGCDRVVTSSRCDQPADYVPPLDPTCQWPEGPRSLAVYATSYRHAIVSRSELGLPNGAPALIRVGLRNTNPDTPGGGPTGCAFGEWDRSGTLGDVCDSVDDRLQLDNLVFRDCAGNELTTTTTEAAVSCDRTLSANFEAIGVRDATSPGVLRDPLWGGGIPSVEIEYGAGVVNAIPMRTEDSGWRVLASLSPPPAGSDPGAGLEMDCRFCTAPVTPCLAPSYPATHVGERLICPLGISLPPAYPLWVGGTVRWVDPTTSAFVEVELPPVIVVQDASPPAGIFDTFPADHATFLEGDPVLVRAELTDDTALATYECAPPTGVPGGTGFGPSFFPGAYRWPAGNHAELVFQWPTPAISASPAAEFAYEDFTLSCSAQDVAQREVVPPIDRAARVVRVPDFGVQPPADLPGGERYDDPARDLRLVNRDAALTISTDLDPTVRAAMAAAGFLVRYELAIEPVELDDVAIDEWGGTFTFREEGVYYLQAVVGRFLTDGTWDAVKLSTNVVVVLVTGIGAVFLSPDVGARGVSYPLARFWQDAEVKLVRPLTGADYPRAGVPLEFRTTGGPLQFANYSNVLSGVLTDANGHAVVPVYATGVPDPGTVEVYEMRPGEDPERVFLADVPIETSRLRITTPTGNPRGLTGSPDNEFCFNADDRGVLRIRTTAEWEDGLAIGPCGIDPDSVPCRLTWEIEAIGPPGGPPGLSWLPSYPDDPRLGLGAENEATYTGLPPSYRDFGYKNVFLAYDLVPWGTQPIEVFFAADADNHEIACETATDTETFHGDSSVCTNAAAYGIQVLGYSIYGGGRRLFDSGLLANQGRTPAVFDWLRYTGRRSTILFGPRSYRCTIGADHCPPRTRLCGLALLDATLIHEGGHVGQILIANGVDFEDSIAGRVTSPEQICPSPPCGWAFAHNGNIVMPPPAVGGTYYNRFLDMPPYNDSFDGCMVDLCIDWDNDAVEDSMDPHPGTSTPADPADLEDFAYAVEPCNADAFLGVDWACPGRNANRSPEFGVGACW